MNFSDSFKVSARMIKSLICLVTTGILIAVYIILNSFIAFNTGSLKITFGYLALAVIGMLYGPAVAALAAVPCDLITAFVVGQGISFVFTPVKIIEGLIYGFILFNMRFSANGRANLMQAIKIASARILVVVICYLTYNSLVLYFISGISGDTFLGFFIPRLIKNIIQYPIDLVLMLILLPTISVVYRKTLWRFGREREL